MTKISRAELTIPRSLRALAIAQSQQRHGDSWRFHSTASDHAAPAKPVIALRGKESRDADDRDDRFA